MSERVTGLIILFSILGLTACGGGSSSGASQGGPAPTAFAGTYQGQFTETLSAGGQSASGSGPVELVVRNDGRLFINTGDETLSCVGESAGTPFLAGNRIDLSLSGSCFVPGVGTCDVFLNGEIVFSATNAVGDGTERLVCPNFGTINGTWGIGAQKVS